MGEKRNSYTSFVVTSEKKRSLERYGRSREDNIGKDLREIVWDVVAWIRLV
jgi:hypothetical protein